MNKSRVTSNDLPAFPREKVSAEQAVRALGNDIVSVQRISALLSRGGTSFMRRCFTPAEIEECLGKANPPVHFAGRWAAKEAVFKVLKLRWTRPFSWKEIEIRSGPDRAPRVHLSQSIRNRDLKNEIPEILLSISHCTDYAFAVALALVREKGDIYGE